jgi:hypothetical protein
MAFMPVLARGNHPMVRRLDDGLQKTMIAASVN